MAIAFMRVDKVVIHFDNGDIKENKYEISASVKRYLDIFKC
ncbi:hypothetical protein [Clostridium gasigenes]|nr:hypothetical protein [Clostridium gasigenes]